jgi:hypothetical protein
VAASFFCVCLTHPQANVLFRNFELLGAADKTLVYLTLFISEALQKLGNQDIESAKKVRVHALC